MRIMKRKLLNAQAFRKKFSILFTRRLDGISQVHYLSQQSFVSRDIFSFADPDLSLGFLMIKKCKRKDTEILSIP
jgi:hypothetical protein